MDEGRAVWNSMADMGNQEPRGRGLRVRRSRVRLKFQAQLDHKDPWGRGAGKEFAHQSEAVGEN